MASALPGVHDLLPTYRCVNDGPAGHRLTEADAVGFGGAPGGVHTGADEENRSATASARSAGSSKATVRPATATGDLE
jgi:hypothetical protein